MFVAVPPACQHREALAVHHRVVPNIAEIRNEQPCAGLDRLLGHATGDLPDQLDLGVLCSVVVLGDLCAGGRGVVGGPQVPTRHERNQQLLPDEDQVGVGEAVHPGDHLIQLAVAVLACGDAEQGVTECDGVVLHVVAFRSAGGTAQSLRRQVARHTSRRLLDFVELVPCQRPIPTAGSRWSQVPAPASAKPPPERLPPRAFTWCAWPAARNRSQSSPRRSAAAPSSPTSPTKVRWRRLPTGWTASTWW